MRLFRDEKGVSPVIGVILMVAITVILAAVIASFVFGMSGTIKPAKTPSFTVTRINNTYVQIVLTSKGGATNISNCNITSPPSAKNATSDSATGIKASGWNVGDVVTLKSTPEGSHLIMMCSVDGRDQVVLDTTI